MVELCQRLTSEEDEEEYEVREKVEMEVAKRGKETLLHFGSSLGLCRLVNYISITSISPTVGGCGLGGLRSSPPSQGQVHRGAAEVDLDLTRGT